MKGVLRSEEARQQAIDKVVTYARDVLHLECLSVVPAAIKGPRGNQGYLALTRKHRAQGQEYSRHCSGADRLSACLHSVRD